MDGASGGPATASIEQIVGSWEHVWGNAYLALRAADMVRAEVIGGRVPMARSGADVPGSHSQSGIGLATPVYASAGSPTWESTPSLETDPAGSTSFVGLDTGRMPTAHLLHRQVGDDRFFVGVATAPARVPIRGRCEALAAVQGSRNRTGCW